MGLSYQRKLYIKKNQIIKLPTVSHTKCIIETRNFRPRSHEFRVVRNVIVRIRFFKKKRIISTETASHCSESDAIALGTVLLH